MLWLQDRLWVWVLLLQLLTQLIHSHILADSAFFTTSVTFSGKTLCGCVMSVMYWHPNVADNYKLLTCVNIQGPDSAFHAVATSGSSSAHSQPHKCILHHFHEILICGIFRKDYLHFCVCVMSVITAPGPNSGGESDGVFQVVLCVCFLRLAADYPL